MLSVQSVNLMSQPAFTRRNNNLFEEAEIVSEKPSKKAPKKRTLSPEQKEKMRLARQEAKRLKDEEKAYNKAVGEWESVRDNLDNIDDIVPESIKKPYKWLKVGSSTVITGLGVVWASKKAGDVTRTALTSDFSKKAGKVIKSTFNTVKKPFVTAYNSVTEYAGKKLSGTKTEEMFNKAKSVVLDNKATKYILEKGAKAKKYTAEKLNKVNFDKVNNVTAGVLGTGSGLAAGYEVARGDA